MVMRTIERPLACCTNPIMPAPVADGEALVAGFKALGDETRLQIFRLIAAQEAPLCACDIVDRFDVSQPTISHHLRVLRQAGLITATKRGVWMYYVVNERGTGALAHFLAQSVRESAAVAD